MGSFSQKFVIPVNILYSSLLHYNLGRWLVDAGLAKTEIHDSTIVTIVPEPTIITEPADTKAFEIIKSIVYGGLTEAITSLGIVTSAASADTATCKWFLF